MLMAHAMELATARVARFYLGTETSRGRGTGLLFEAYGRLGEHERDRLRVEIIGEEALKTSEIEGEFLDRENRPGQVRALPSEYRFTNLKADFESCAFVFFGDADRGKIV